MFSPSSGELDAVYRASDFHGLAHSISRRCCLGRSRIRGDWGVARGGCGGATQALLESKVTNLASRLQTSPATAGHPGRGRLDVRSCRGGWPDYKNISNAAESVGRARITKKILEIRQIGNIKG